VEVVDQRRKSVVERLKEQPVFKKVLGVKNISIIVVTIIIALALLIYSSVDKEDSSVNDMDDEEMRLSAVLSEIEGAGKVTTMIVREDGKVKGVLVIAEGAEDISVMLKLLNATSTVMGVDRSVVEVYEME
jgi:stage III sporulation protein AG